jgi:putative transposase
VIVVFELLGGAHAAPPTPPTRPAAVRRLPPYLPHNVHFRKAAGLNPEVVDVIRSELLRTADDYRVEIVAYCFMPDHLHALIEGQSAHSDLRKCIRMFRQRSGRLFRTRFDRRLWQEGYFDRFLRNDEASPSVIAYIIANPLRATLCSDVRDYPFIGSGTFTIAELIDTLA